MFTIARFFSGIAVDAASVVSPAYTAEISPPQIRGRLASLQQLGIVVGIFASLLSDHLLARTARRANGALWGDLAAWHWMFPRRSPAVVGLRVRVRAHPRVAPLPGRGEARGAPDGDHGARVREPLRLRVRHVVGAGRVGPGSSPSRFLRSSRPQDPAPCTPCIWRSRSCRSGSWRRRRAVRSRRPEGRAHRHLERSQPLRRDSNAYLTMDDAASAVHFAGNGGAGRVPGRIIHRRPFDGIRRVGGGLSNGTEEA